MPSNLADEVAKAAASTARTSTSAPVQVLSLTIQLVAAWRATKDDNYEKAAKELAHLNMVYGKQDRVLFLGERLGTVQATVLSAALEAEGIKVYHLARGLIAVHESDLERAREIAREGGIDLKQIQAGREELEEAVPEATEIVEEAQARAERGEAQEAAKAEEKDRGDAAEYPSGEPDEARGGFNISLEYNLAAIRRVTVAIEAGQGLDRDGLEQREPSR